MALTVEATCGSCGAEYVTRAKAQSENDVACEPSNPFWCLICNDQVGWQLNHCPKGQPHFFLRYENTANFIRPATCDKRKA